MTDTSLQHRLDELVADMASILMPVSVTTRDSALQQALGRMVEFFGVDTAFMRRNVHDEGVTILAAEWPPRVDVPDPDPLGVVPFDADPIFAATRELSEPFVTLPSDSPEEYQQRVRDGSGVPQVSMAMVPLLHDDTTHGVLGFINFGHRPWEDSEINALRSIASLVMQLERRLDAEQRLVHAALHDELTGLPNRRSLADELERRLTGGTTATAVLFVDLDRFKIMNDFLGHAAGDKLLMAVAARLREAVRRDDFVGRLGGDEFLILTETSPTGDEAMVTARRLIEVIANPIQIEGQYVKHTASVGISIGRPGRDGGQDLLRRADVALYEAKGAGRNRIVVFDDVLQASVAERSDTELYLRQAIDRHSGLCLYYQPEFDLRTGELLAAEALVRWNHPMRGLVTAGQFIAVAEETGLIVDMGWWIIEEGCRQLATWRRAFGAEGFVLRLNMSPQQLAAPQIVDFVARQLIEHRVPAEALCIEITEHAVCRKEDQAAEVLNGLRGLGIELAIDDFGTGYSSLGQLKHMPVQVLKIDQSFVANITSCPQDRAVVDSIVSLAGAFGLDLVAEGIEEPAMAAELLRLGCHRGQGYLLGRPAPAEVLEAILAQGGVDLDRLVPDRPSRAMR